MQSSKLGILVEFGSFDKFISDAIDNNSQFSHREIKQADYPVLIDSLRDWLIRQSGRFEVIGYYRPADLSLWYENETLVEVYDGLLLEFREYLGMEKGLEANRKYTLRRYMDNVSFIMTEGLEEQPVIIGVELSDEVDTLFDSVKKTLLDASEGHTYHIDGLELDPQMFIEDLFKDPNTRAIFEKHLK